MSRLLECCQSKCWIAQARRRLLWHWLASCGEGSTLDCVDHKLQRVGGGHPGVSKTFPYILLKELGNHNIFPLQIEPAVPYRPTNISYRDYRSSQDLVETRWNWSSFTAPCLLTTTWGQLQDGRLSWPPQNPETSRDGATKSWDEQTWHERPWETCPDALSCDSADKPMFAFEACAQLHPARKKELKFVWVLKNSHVRRTMGKLCPVAMLRINWCLCSSHPWNCPGEQVLWNRSISWLMLAGCHVRNLFTYSPCISDNLNRCYL